MPTLEPMLRDRLKSPAPSARCSGDSVDRVTALSGTKRKPRPMPWITPTTTIVVCETSGVQPVIA